MFKLSPANLQTFIDTRLTLTPSVIPNSNYVIIVSNLNCLKYFCVFCTVIIRCTDTFWSPCCHSGQSVAQPEFETGISVTRFLGTVWCMGTEMCVCVCDCVSVCVCDCVSVCVIVWRFCWFYDTAVSDMAEDAVLMTWQCKQQCSVAVSVQIAV
jgi:hypothetical protein